MKNITFLFLLVSFSFAQYSPQFHDLTKTTFLREFDKNIISGYLNSGEYQKVNAALLSIAQSEDTSFIKEIEKLNFNEYGNLISFALGELGECQSSSDYLLTQLSESDNPYSIPLYEAIGKIGEEEDLLETVEIFKQTNSDGYPLAVYNFHVRGITDTTGNDVNILLKNLKLTDQPDKLFRSLFALYRVAPTEVNSKDLEVLLKGKFDPSIKTYALGILRKNKSFPYPFDLAKSLMEDKEWSVRCEAARTTCYYNYEKVEQLEEFLKLVYDVNPNVAITAAQSISNLVIESDELNDKLPELIKIMLNEPLLSENAKGELLLFLANEGYQSTENLVDKYSVATNTNYVYRLLGSADDYNYGFSKLREMYKPADDYNKFMIFSSVSNFYDSLKSDKDYSAFLIDQYSSDYPLVITLNNFIIDSSFAADNLTRLKTEIMGMIDKRINNSEFNQAISTIFNVTDQMDTLVSNIILRKISESDNYLLQYDLRDQIEVSETAKNKRAELFDKLFAKSFEYSKVKVNTNKGSFTIELTPQVAPISVGNFIYLTEQNFFDRVFFHRVVPNFVIQTGDPSGTGWSGPSHTIVSEFSPQPFDTYYVGMASSGKDTEGSQWFVMQNHYPHLNGNYTNFGKVIDGFDVVNVIDQYDVVESIELIK